MSAAAMSVPRVNETERVALDRAERAEGGSRLSVSIEERCGDQLVEAFVRMAGDYYARPREREARRWARKSLCR